MKSNIKQFDLDDLQKIRKNLFEEINKSSEGTKTSLPFIENLIPLRNKSINGRGRVIVVGGSNLISALVKKENDQIIIEQIEKEDLPKLDSARIFMEMLANNILVDTKLLALNFGYPLQVINRDNKIDGKLLEGAKEHKFEGLIGKNIGEELEKYLFVKRNKKVDVSVANDIVCLIKAGSSKTQWQETVGGIVGTGFNFGFYLDERTIINIESGYFANFPQTETGKIVDKKSLNPGRHLFEKEISGGYIYKHYNVIAKILDLPFKNVSSTLELNEVAIKDKGCDKTICELFKRSASLVACQIAALYDYKNQSSLTIYMEGSLFWKGKNYKEYVFDFLLKLGIPYGKVKIEKIEKSYVLGAARLIL